MEENKHERAYRTLAWWRDCWNWLGECPFHDGQPFIETATSAPEFNEAQQEVHNYVKNEWKNPEAIELIEELERGENSEDEVYELLAELMFSDPQNRIGK